jgi:hypothetical protein
MRLRFLLCCASVARLPALARRAGVANVEGCAGFETIEILASA